MRNAEIQKSLIKVSYDFLGGRVSGRELVKKIDEMVSNDDFETFSEDFKSMLDDFHDSLALYVADEMKIKEAPESYFGEEQLVLEVTEFVQSIGQTN